MIDGTQHTPTQADSHAELQARQGWSVAAMREQMDAKDKKIEELNQLLFEGYNHVNTLKENLSEVVKGARSLQRQLNGFQAPVRNALNLLRLVNCGNLDQAKISQAILVLEDIDKKRPDFDTAFKQGAEKGSALDGVLTELANHDQEK